MWTLPDGHFTELQKILRETSLDVSVKEEFGAQSPGFRDKIKQALPAEREHSISHTHGLGGFASVSTPRKIGFDIEVSGRVSDEIALRISDAKEFALAPSAAHLWVAKEATFKALKGATQPKIMGAIRVGRWAKVGSNFETFHIETPDLGPESASIGVVFLHKAFIFGLFVI